MPEMLAEDIALLSASARLQRAREALRLIRLKSETSDLGDSALADAVQENSGVDFESALLAVLTTTR